MTRRELLIGAALTFGAASPAMAKDLSETIIRKLKRRGYDIVSVSRTLLGRVRILARKSGAEREIIVNPATGEILRDLWVSGGDGDLDYDDSGGGSSGEGSGGKDDGGDDDSNGGDGDNSGHGGGGDDGDNSGKGGDGGDDD